MIKQSVSPVVSACSKQSVRDDRVKKTLVTFDPVLNSYCELDSAFTPSGDFEIEVDISTTASGSQITIARGSGVDFIAIDISSGNSARFWASVGGVTQTIITGSSVNDGDLHTIKVTYTGTTAELFIDGVSQGTATWALDGGQDLTMIGRTPGASNYFDGIISNVKLTDLATPANSQHYALNRITGNTETSLINSGSITYNNIPDSDREVFSWDAANGYWVGSDELITNGGFDTDSGWTKNTGWSITEGQAVYDGDIGGVALIYQDANRPPNYLIAINMPVMDGSGLEIYDGASYSTNITEAGISEFTVTNGNEGYRFFTMRADTDDNDIKIESVSMKRILQVA